MSITEIDHIVIAVADIEEGIRNWRDGLGLHLTHTAENAEAGIKQAFFALADGTFIELIAPAHESSPISTSLAARGEGVQVIALKVDDLDASVAALQERGVRLIGVGTPQVFIHPKSANGVMLQLWPRDRPHRWQANPNHAQQQQN